MKLNQMSKKEHIANLTDKNGNYKIFAIDHREVFINYMTKRQGVEPSFKDIVTTKMELIKRTNDIASSYLLDPVYSVDQARDDCVLNNKGVLIGIEGNDYSSVSFGDNYLTDLINVKGIWEKGGDCVKLFIYFYFDDEIIEKQKKLINQLSLECKKYNLPLLLEPILAPKYFKTDGQEFVQNNIKMVESLSDLDVDIFKLLFPSRINEFTKEECVEHCKEVTNSLKVPYILLSSGVDVDTFYKQLLIYTQAGGSGFAVGRTLWGSCLELNNKNFEKNISIMLEKLHKMCNIIDRTK